MNSILFLALCASTISCADAQHTVHYDWYVLLQAGVEKKKVQHHAVQHHAKLTSHRHPSQSMVNKHKIRSTSNRTVEQTPPSTDTPSWFKNQINGLVQWANSTASIQQLFFMNQFRGWLETMSRTPGATADITSKMEKLVVSTDAWTHCTQENNDCHCASGMVRYGSRNRWAYKNHSSGFSCSNSFFREDPAAGEPKLCQCYAYSRTLRCKGGGPVDWSRCAVGSQAAADKATEPLAAEYFCQEGCRAGAALATVLVSGARRGDRRGALCAGGERLEPLFSCESAATGLQEHPAHSAAEMNFREATAKLCSSPAHRDYLDISLDCRFKSNFLRWSQNQSDGWLHEAFVTYAAGKKNSHFEWMATNLVRSVHLFSARPIVVVLFDEAFSPPVEWLSFPNVIVYKMIRQPRRVSFNFNKIRAMVAARVDTGIELDLDQIVAPGIDRVFAGTRREVTAEYPYPIMPVHWMSRDAGKGEPYHEYEFTAYSGRHTMRWNHAHPTWTHWALPFLSELLYMRLAPMRAGRVWMNEDEDMMNVMLWQRGVDKAWCKFDLEPDLFAEGGPERNFYWDTQWYPQGLPLLFYSTHNSKDVESTDRLLTLFTRCAEVKHHVTTDECLQEPHKVESWGRFGDRASFFERDPLKASASECCYVKIREATPAFWEGRWYADPSAVPLTSSRNTTRRCLMP